jgi:predicted Zn-ribbon and HTH transcriptional regulator
MDFEKHYIASTIIQILPESRKPAEVKDIKEIKAKDIFKKETDEIIDLIKKLGELHSAGILTDEEFSNKKLELLSKI